MRQLAIIGVLVATGAEAGPLLQVIEPADRDHAYGNVPIGATSATQQIVVRNVGDANARIGEMLISPEFPLTGPMTPPTITLPPGGELTWDVACKPTVGGTVSTFFDIHYCDAACDPIDTRVAIRLNCYGGLFTTPTNVFATAFADQVGQNTFTATNREATPVTITALQTTAPFTASAGTLPVTVAAGDSITITVNYDASAGNTNAPLDLIAGTQVVGRLNLTGAVKNQIQPEFWRFEAVPQGATYTRPVRIRNSSASSRTITNLVFDLADYSVSGGVGTTLGPGASTEVLVTLQANTLGTRQGTLTVAFDTGAGNSAIFVADVISAAYTLASTDATPNDGWLDFGTIAVSGGPVDKTFTITHATGANVLECDPVGPPFSLVNCPATLPANTPVTVAVRVTPTVSGEFFDAPTVKIIPLVGPTLLASRVRIVPNAFTAPPDAAVAAAVRANTTNVTHVVTNHLSTPITLPLEVSGTGFSLVGPASRVFAPGANDVTIAVTPPAAGMFTGTLTIGATADPDRTVVALSANATDPMVTADAATLDLGEVVVGSVGTAMLAITNHDPSRTFTLGSFAIVGGAGFSAVMPANPTLAPGESVAVEVRFTAEFAGAAGGQLSVFLANDTAPIAVVQLAAVGVVEEEPDRDNGCCGASAVGASPVFAVIVLALVGRRRRRR